MKKKVLLIGILAIALAAVSCKEKEDEFIKDEISSNEEDELVIDNQTDASQLKFAKILSIALSDNSELRSLMKSEALKRFDNDDEVL